MLFGQPADIKARLDSHCCLIWKSQEMALVTYKWDQYMNAWAQGFVEFAKAFHNKGCLFRHNPAQSLHRLD